MNPNMKKILISLSLGLFYWLTGLLIYSLNDALKEIVILMVFPFVIGILTQQLIADIALQRLLVHSFGAILFRHLLSWARLFVILSTTGDYNSYIVDAIKSFLFFSGPVELFFAFLGCYIASKFATRWNHRRSQA